MDHARIEWNLRHTPSLRLLQKDTAPLIISFLYQQFKHAHRITVPASDLTTRLEEYLDLLNAEQPGLYPRPAAAYLKQWTDDDHRLLRSYYAANNDDPLYELTPDAETALGWFEDIQATPFVGTESRFLRIFALLEEIVGRGSENAQIRLAQLEQQQAAIEREVEMIRQTGKVEQLTPTQIKERFVEANDVARRLLADFREVEQNFRQIAATVQKAQLEHGAHKGAVVGHVLDADAALKESEQGRSFYAFWEFLRSPTHQDQLRDLLHFAYDLPPIAALHNEYPLLRRVKQHLLDASEKIVQSNHRLGEQLRKMLDERNAAESRRVRELITEIKQIAVRLEHLPTDTFFTLEGAPDVRLPMEKALWEPSTPPTFAASTLDVAAANVDQVDLSALYRQFYVDEALLRERIDTLLQTRSEITLLDLAAHYPLRKGLAEVITYLHIAAQSTVHLIDGDTWDDLPLDTPPAAGQNERARRVLVPHVVYRHGEHR